MACLSEAETDSGRMPMNTHTWKNRALAIGFAGATAITVVCSASAARRAGRALGVGRRRLLRRAVGGRIDRRRARAAVLLRLRLSGLWVRLWLRPPLLPPLFIRSRFLLLIGVTPI